MTAGQWRCIAGLMSFPIQSFLSVFRSLVMLEKTVEKCCISLNGRSSLLVVQLHCKYGEWAAGQRGGGWGQDVGVDVGVDVGDAH